VGGRVSTGARPWGIDAQSDVFNRARPAKSDVPRRRSTVWNRVSDLSERCRLCAQSMGRWRVDEVYDDPGDFDRPALGVVDVTKIQVRLRRTGT